MSGAASAGAGSERPKLSEFTAWEKGTGGGACREHDAAPPVARAVPRAASMKQRGKRARRPSGGRIGVALGGGGPVGGMYELGVLCALEEAVEGLDVTTAYRYVGISAGALLAAMLANGLPPRRLARMLFRREAGEEPFDPTVFLAPAIREWSRGARRLPRLLGQAAWRYARGRNRGALVSSLVHVARAVPLGVFDNEPIRAYVQRVIQCTGGTDDFRDLGGRLSIVATEVASGRAALFGRAGLDHVPISKAVQASTAIPGMYLPVEIGGRYYVDGAVPKTLHASAVLDDGVDLLIAVNPLVPVDMVAAAEAGTTSHGTIVANGLPALLSQSLRTMLHSRMQASLAGYERRYPGSDVLLLEPRCDDARMFHVDVFDFASRQTVCDQAYDAARAHLRARRAALAPVLARHGLRLRDEVLDDPARDFWDAVGLRPAVRRSRVTRELEKALMRAEALL